MDFSGIRQSNIFGGNTGGARKRPFGMPDIDTETTGQMLDDLIPRAENFNRQKQIRDQEQMRFEFNLKNPKPQLSMTDKAYGYTQPGGGNAPGGGSVSAAPQGGSRGNFSPMQQMFQERDALDKKRKYDAEQNTQEQQSKYRQAIDERGLQEAGAMRRTGMEVEGRYGNTKLEGDMRAQLAQQKAIDDAAAAKAAHGYHLTEDERKEIARTKGDILVNESRPPNAAQIVSGKEGLDNINLNARRFTIEHPDMAGALKTDPTTGDVTGIDTSRVSEQQLRYIQQYLTGRGTVKPGSRPAPAPPKAGPTTPGRGTLMGQSRTAGGK